jgi:hypothetical protein
MEKTITQPEPAWLEETPDIDYSLTMMRDGLSDDEQDIPLTRREFEALKHELAVMRGYIAEDEDEDVAEKPAEEAREPESEVQIVTEAKRPGTKIAARALVDDAREDFELFIQDASAEDIHVLQQALAFGATGGSIVKSFLMTIGMDMPEGVAATCLKPGAAADLKNPKSPFLSLWTHLRDANDFRKRLRMRWTFSTMTDLMLLRSRSNATF